VERVNTHFTKSILEKKIDKKLNPNLTKSILEKKSIKN
jgi:hypothetical protein